MGQTFNFGKALEALKAGKKIARLGWNGAGMFAFLVSGGIYEHETIGIYKSRPYMMLKTAQNDVATWVPSGSDILAEDWMIVE